MVAVLGRSLKVQDYKIPANQSAVNTHVRIVLDGRDGVVEGTGARGKRGVDVPARF